MPTPQTFTGQLTLTAGHSLMLSTVPTSIMQNSITGLTLQKLSEDFPKFSKLKETQESFGLFSICDYGQYYPDVSAEDLLPKSEDFIEPMYRLLSATTIGQGHLPTEFPEDVLKKSLNLAIGQTIYLDHDDSVGNSIGVISSAVWQAAFEQEGISIPAGINGVFKIDGKSNPRIARGIMMTPPSIHSNSVTVMFEWKPSHTFTDVYDFYNRLGTYDENGDMVRRIATKIIAYKESSLVSHGADPYAQLIDENGKINDPGYANRINATVQQNSIANDTELNEFLKANQSCVSSYKHIEEPVVNQLNTGSSNIENQEQINNQNKQTMEQFLSLIFGEGLLSLSAGETASEELVLKQVQQLASEVTSLREMNGTLKAEKTSLEQLASLGSTFITGLREQTVASYRKLTGENADEAILQLISAETTSKETLDSLKKSYEEQLQAKLPLHCEKCGSLEVSRSSSAPEGNETEGKDNGGTTETVETTVAGLANRKRFNKQ